jgi:hypothetical protein
VFGLAELETKDKAEPFVPLVNRVDGFFSHDMRNAADNGAGSGSGSGQEAPRGPTGSWLSLMLDCLLRELVLLARLCVDAASFAASLPCLDALLQWPSRLRSPPTVASAKRRCMPFPRLCSETSPNDAC